MSTTNTTCKVADSCQQIIDSKDKEIKKLESETERLETEIKEYEKREKYYRMFLIIQAGLLMAGFQIFDL